MARPLYFDNAASTPLDPRVLRAMKPYFVSKHGNPGSLHSFGQEAMAAVDQSRETIATLLGAKFRNILFTASATEANNLAIRGTVIRYRREHPDATPVRVIVSAIEHESVLEAARDLKNFGVDVVELPVDRSGVVALKSLEEALTPGTILVSIMYANNEIGTIQPIKSIATIVKEYRDARKSRYPLFHTDASQAFQFLDCNATTLGVDLMTLSSHKVYGPKGVGVLYTATDVVPDALILGGGQEFGLRSGTENVPAIVGCAAAMKLAYAMRESETKRQQALTGHFVRQIAKALPKARLNGAKRLPNIVNIHLPGKLASDTVMECDLAGLAVGSGSACASRSFVPSYVLRALGHAPARARESVRFSIGRFTTKTDVDTALAIVRRLA